MLDLKLRRIGNSYGVVLPKDVLGRPRVKQGDRLFLTETADGAYRITPCDPASGRQMNLAEEGMAPYRNTLSLAAGAIDEHACAAWLRSNSAG